MLRKKEQNATITSDNKDGLFYLLLRYKHFESILELISMNEC